MRRIITLIALFFHAGLFSQSIERFSIGSGGGEGQSSSARITWSVGEAQVLTLQGTANMLTQGFQQLYFSNSIFTNSLANKTVVVNAYPNPFQDFIIVQVVLPITGSYSYSIYNSLGCLTAKGRLDQSCIHIDTRLLDAGDYYLQVTDGNTLKTFKIIKN